jgi:UDP-glucose 4-epimerase
MGSIQRDATTFDNVTSHGKPKFETFILVIGGLGYIGSHTSWEMLKAGYNVIIVDNMANSHLSTLGKLRYLVARKYGTRQPCLHFYEADYRNQLAMRSIFEAYKIGPNLNTGISSSQKSRISGVIHFAALKSASESFKVPLEYYANNIAGLIEFCKLMQHYIIKRFIFSSSATVYGEQADKNPRLVEGLCTSNTCIGLTNPYGRSKWMSEAILSDLASSDPEWTIVALRYFNPIGCDEFGILGEDPRNNPNNLMPCIIKTMTGELPELSLLGSDWDTPDGTPVRDFIHVSDLALGHLSALGACEDGRLTGGFYALNLGTGVGHSVKEVVSAVEDAFSVKIPIKVTSRREGDIASCIADPSKASRVLNWTAQKTLDNCCQDLSRFLHKKSVH